MAGWAVEPGVVADLALLSLGDLASEGSVAG